MPSLPLLEQCKWTVKWYWKVNGVGEYRDIGEINLPYSTVTITRLHNELETAEQHTMSIQ
jgi:hypothetical protein